MPFLCVPSGFGGDHPHGRRHSFHHHHGPPHHHHHHHGPPPFPNPHHHHGPPPFLPSHGPPPMMMAGPPPMFGRRGRRFMMHFEKDSHEKPDAEAPNADPAVDRPPFLPHRHHGPPPVMMMMAGGPPMFGRRGRRFMMNVKDLQEKSESQADNGETDPKPRPHCRRGGPRGTCSDLPREEESPIGAPKNQESNETEPQTSKEAPGIQSSFRHFHPACPPHIQRRHRHFHKKMMLLSLLEEQKRKMEKLAEQNKNNFDGTETKAGGESETSSATTSSPAIQATQQWHTTETDQGLVLMIDVTGFKLENLELKVENGLLSLRGLRTNVLGDVFELFRTKAVDPMLYEETGIEARCENLDESSILRISIPKKEYTVKNDGAIPIQAVECLSEEPRESSNTAAASFIEEDKKEQTDGFLEDNIFITEAEIVFERVEDEEALGQVETVQEESVASFEAAQALHSGATDDALDAVSDNESDTAQSWEDLVADERNEE